VCIAFTIAALNDLKVKLEDIMNAYLMAPVVKRIWTVLRPEFEIDKGKRGIIVRVLYELKSAGNFFAITL